MPRHHMETGAFLSYTVPVASNGVPPRFCTGGWGGAMSDRGPLGYARSDDSVGYPSNATSSPADEISIGLFSWLVSG